jgi:hypothetical protein
MADEVEKFLNDRQQLETRRQELIEDVLRQKEAANKAFDEKLAKLGYNKEEHAAKRSHHKHAAAEKSDGRPSAKAATSSTPAA